MVLKLCQKNYPLYKKKKWGMVPFLLEGGNSMQVLKYGNTVEGQMNFVCDGKDAT